MAKLLIQGIIVLLIWVGGWGIAEMGVDSIAGDDKPLRFVVYSLFLVFGVFLLWIAELALEDD